MLSSFYPVGCRLYGISVDQPHEAGALRSCSVFCNKRKHLSDGVLCHFKKKVVNTLTKKQQRFVDEYLIDLNATQAAIRAGYSPDTAQSRSAAAVQESIKIVSSMRLPRLRFSIQRM